MTVIDLRDELYERQIEIIEITDDFVYYAEELRINGVDCIYLYSYSFSDENEKIMSHFAFDDETYLQHYYPCKDSIIVLFENDSSKVWIVKIDKNTCEEVLRKSVPLIGRFSECVPVDDSNIIIYTKSNDEKKELFNRCLEETNSDTIANLYDIEKGYRYFIKDFDTARLVKNSMYTFKNSKQREYLLLCDPYADEKTKEELSKDSDKISEDIRDNIWLISQKKFLEGVKRGKEHLERRRIASAGIEGFVRFECIGNDSIIFRAKQFSTGQERFCAMSMNSGKVSPIAPVHAQNSDACYFTDSSSGKVYYLTRDFDTVTLQGEINSRASITYPESVGRIECCIDDRFIIADNSQDSDNPIFSIYDGKLNCNDTHQSHLSAKGDKVILY